jgi:cell division protein ZapA (FtsZ GTPase activity inhibitor)
MSHDSATSETIEVTIFNQTFRLRSKTDRERVEQIARLVDERMRQISSQITTHDVSKIAILAALNIADELQSLINYYEGETREAGGENETKTVRESSQPQSWFEDFFDAKVETKNREERLSSQVSAKLQTRRPSSPEPIEITTEENDVE